MQIKMIRGFKGPGYHAKPGEVIDTDSHRMTEGEARYLCRERHAEYVKGDGEQQPAGDGGSKGQKSGGGKKSKGDGEQSNS